MAKSRNMLVAVGANATSWAGSPLETVKAALAALATRFPDLHASPLYSTPAFPPGAGPDFVNGACVFTSDLPASDVLTQLHSIEASFDRTRTTRWGTRTVDLDLIGCGDAIAPDAATFDLWRKLPLDQQMEQTPDQLILPHPRLQDRSFVLVPLADVAPDWIHPVLGLTVREMRDARPADERATVLPL